MAFTTTLENARKDLEKTITDPTPLYAVVGVTDLAVAKLRAAGAKLDPKSLRAQAQARVGNVPADVKDAPTQAQAVLGEAVSTALATYGELAGRGKDVVSRVRRQQATVDLEAQAKTAVSHAKATSTTAKRSTASTKKSAKSATTSARKTASAARRATTDGSKKVGS